MNATTNIVNGIQYQTCHWHMHDGWLRVASASTECQFRILLIFPLPGTGAAVAQCPFFGGLKRADQQKVFLGVLCLLAQAIVYCLY